MLLLLGVAGLLIVAADNAAAQPRMALVIGNSAYEGSASLRNPVNDAVLMRDTLAELGFDVTVKTDAGRQAMADAVALFAENLRTAGPGTFGVFYYAGHGIQVDGENYLIPIGAENVDERLLTSRGVKAREVVEAMERREGGVNVVVLDACRNNPYKTRGLVGLARMHVDEQAGSLVAFAAAAGQTAKDGEGRNSPYTRALAAALRKPGLTVEGVFNEVQSRVYQATGAPATAELGGRYRRRCVLRAAGTGHARSTRPRAADHGRAGCRSRGVESGA